MPASALKKQSISSQEKQTSILVVDDNRRYRDRLRRMLSHICPQGLIHEAENSNVALEIVKRMSPELIFVDVILGDEDGIQCARRAKEQSQQSMVILMSAYPDKAFHQRGLEVGVKAFLDKKDIDADTLYQIVSDVVQ
jgi:CheY-like chemotaxis protein